jgi:hypothetical protein
MLIQAALEAHVNAVLVQALATVSVVVPGEPNTPILIELTPAVADELV